jgi:hypothetical protein
LIRGSSAAILVVEIAPGGGPVADAAAKSGAGEQAA